MDEYEDGVHQAEAKICPFCSEDIKATAVKCRHCGSFLVPMSDNMPGQGNTITIVNTIAERPEREPQEPQDRRYVQGIVGVVLAIVFIPVPGFEGDVYATFALINFFILLWMGSIGRRPGTSIALPGIAIFVALVSLFSALAQI